MTAELFQALQRQMVEIISLHAQDVREQIGNDGLDTRVLDVMGRVPRHAFVPLEITPYAYLAQPLPIGYEKTISQPFIVALMTHLLDLHPDDSILEVGTGLGYHTAILSELVAAVYSVEIVEELGEQARKRLQSAGFANVTVRIGNGERGWTDHAPFDKILVCAAPEMIPVTLLNQLKPGGRMVLPVGFAEDQKLLLAEKNAGGRLSTREILPVRFATLESGN
jgi:protein-L-isoaspartate(D-aspartate) O-methyltransferase